MASEPEGEGADESNAVGGHHSNSRGVDLVESIDKGSILCFGSTTNR